MPAQDHKYRFRDIARKSDETGKTVWSVLGAVMVPREVDTQGESITAEDVENAAHDWFLHGRAAKIDTNHDYRENGCVAVESYIAPEGDPNFTPGTWAVRVRIRDPEIGKKIDSGELNGFSWAGPVHRAVFLTRLSHPVEARGTTEKSDGGPYPTHDHRVESLRFDDDARVVPTYTAEAFGHRHMIIGTTRTERYRGHAHGILLRRPDAA